MIWALDLLCASGSNCKRWRFFGGAPPAPGEPESGCNRIQDRVMQKTADGNSRSCREQEGEVPHTQRAAVRSIPSARLHIAGQAGAGQEAEEGMHQEERTRLRP